MDLFPPNLNSRPLPIPQPAPTQTVSVHDLIQIRCALDALTFRSKLTDESIAHLDKVIHAFTSSLNPGVGKP